MKKIIIVLMIISSYMIAETLKKELQLKKEKQELEKVQKILNKTEKWKKEVSSIMKTNKKTNKNKYFNMLEDGRNETFMGTKQSKMRLPSREEEYLKNPLDRAEYVNSPKIERESIKISKKSINMSILYKFLSTYGTLPRKDGNLPKEQYLYKLIESGELKVTKTVKKESRTKIKPVTHFLKISR